MFEESTITWGGLWERVEQSAQYVGNRLKSDQQEVAGILLPNSIDFIIAYLAVVHSGHIALLMDPAYKGLELDNIIEQIPPKFIITDEEYKNRLSSEHQSSAILIDEMSESYRMVEFLRLASDKQVACLMFTSGTTGKPKAVPNTHANHLWNIKVCSEVWDWTSDDSLLIASPLSHMLAIVTGLPGALYHGNTIYLHRWFDQESVLKDLASGKISFFSHAASAYVKLAQSSGNYDLSAVRLCVSGAAPLPPAVWQEFKDRYGIEIVETYGSSETGRIAGNRLHERVLGSPGRPFPEVDLKLSTDGEVLVKSPGVFPGYYNNPQETQAGMTSDGYWRTGDLAEIKKGYVYLKGRLQERIRRFGYTVSPRDVEWALHKHPAIRDVYVMGRQIENEPSDELIYFIVTDLSDEEILAFCKQNLLFAWRPDKIMRLKELPRTRSGKAKIAMLKEMVN